MTPEDWLAIKLSFQLAGTTVLVLLLLGTPLAYWLAYTRSKWKNIVSAIVALPLVLPPTVIGFYLLLALGPNGFIGRLSIALGLGSLAFSYTGLVIGSVLYSLPFVVQPIRNAIEAIGRVPLEVAASLGAGPFARFFKVILPLAKNGFYTAGILGFLHTLGEFGVILMIGGNIPGETRVVSIQLYDHVEALAYDEAHRLALILLVLSFAILVLVYQVNRSTKAIKLT